ncbi:MAG: NAD(P)H-dependent oxidoreductase subunit E [Verrucomicrobia bacterium]|nr:NAD(P)H-dependent oxidoreductase subunit E [Verrucomicrobiota bacterium]
MIASRQSQAMTGAVMVIGGGIAGIQSALDLADSGFKVYLVEATPAIGGNMARLDKTFPTNDCSMCILSPKLVEAARHRNIELLTLAEVQGVTGSAGHFQIEVKQKARYVDATKCTGCGLCLAQCPTRNLPRFDVEQEPVIIDLQIKTLVDDLLAKHGTSPNAVIRVLQEVNVRLRYLPREVITYLDRTLDIPASRLYRLGTFYKSFSFIERGRHTISLCDGTACHIRGSARLIAELKRELKIDVGQTTPDRRFSLEIVRCLGCCSLAPVVKVDERIYGNVKSAEIAKILKDYPT